MTRKTTVTVRNVRREGDRVFVAMTATSAEGFDFEGSMYGYAGESDGIRTGEQVVCTSGETAASFGRYGRRVVDAMRRTAAARWPAGELR